MLAGAPLLVSTTSDAPVLVGPASAQRRVLRAIAEGVSRACEQVLSVLPAATPAALAPWQGVKVLLGSVSPKVNYACRVFPPALVQDELGAAYATFEDTLRQLLAWSAPEWEAARRQLQLPRDEGGLGLPPLDVLCPAAHLASWLAAARVLGWGGSPAQWLATSPLPQAASLRALFNACKRKAPAGFPVSPAGLDEASVSVALRSRKGAPRWQAQFLLWLATGQRESWLRSLDAPARAATRRRLTESGGAWLTLEVPYGTRVTTPIFRVAMRMRFGLSVLPAIPRDPPERRCSLTNLDKQRCPALLDCCGILCGKSIRIHTWGFRFYQCWAV